jgi:hypothetical protein
VKLAGSLLLLSFCLSDAQAGGIAGTKERVTFEGLVGRHERDNIPDYDGFGWSGTIYAIGKGLCKDQQGFHAVVKGKVAAAFFAGTGQDGIISRDDGSKFTFRSGHFAAFGNFNSDVTFSAYRKGILIGTRSLTLAPADTLVQFDKTFAHIDRFVIDGESVAFDNLHVSF